MPNLLTSIFDPTDEQQSEDFGSAGAEQDLFIDQQVGLDVGVGYEGADGSSHELALDNEVGVTLGASTATDALLSSESATDSG